MWSPLIELGETHDVGLRMGMFMTVFACGVLVGLPISGAIQQRTGNYTAVGIYAGAWCYFLTMRLCSNADMLGYIAMVVIASTFMLLGVRHLVLRRLWGKV